MSTPIHLLTQTVAGREQGRVVNSVAFICTEHCSVQHQIVHVCVGGVAYPPAHVGSTRVATLILYCTDTTFNLAAIGLEASRCAMKECCKGKHGS